MQCTNLFLPANVLSTQFFQEVDTVGEGGGVRILNS